MDEGRRRALRDYLAEMRRKGCVVSTAAERGLFLTRQAFEEHMLVEADGVELLRRLEAGHWREAERRGLVKAGREAVGVVFQVRNWRGLVDFLRSVQ